MSARLPLFSLLWLALVAGPALADLEDPNSVSHGPILGRLSEHGVGVWARTALPGTIAVRYGLAADRLDQVTRAVPTTVAHDNTGWVHVTGLRSNTRYYYEVFCPDQNEKTDARGSFRTLPDAKEYVDPELNPRGLFNFEFEFACGNNQNPSHSVGPLLPTFTTMNREIRDDINFAILNGDWLYESQRDYSPARWQAQVNEIGKPLPNVVEVAPTITGVWQNYKHFLDQGEPLAEWHANMPSFFTYDDHEMLNDVWGAGSPGLRDRRAVFRDIGARAWYDYLGWANPTEFTQPVQFGRATLKKGSGVLEDPAADFTKLDLAMANNLHVHWGEPTAGINDTALDDVGGVPNAGVYRIAEVLGKTQLRIEPAADADGVDSYSIGRRAYFRKRVANCDLFFCDTRGQREMHDTKDPYKDISMLGREQREWLLEGTRNSDADFVFVISSVNFMVPHVGGGKVRGTNKDDAWTVFFKERELLVDAWDELDKPVLVLTGDLHNSFVIKITDNVWECASGPHNSNNHWASDEGDRPANGPFKYGPREVDIRWSTYFRSDIPRDQLMHPGYCVVQVNNVFDNPQTVGNHRWVAFPRPQVVFQYFDGRTGKLRYAESVIANPRK